MVDESVLKKIDQAKKEQRTSLDLSHAYFQELPSQIGQLTYLEELDLSSNQLTTLPESLGQLSNLTGLYLGYNQLTTLPESLGQLSNLTVLDLGYNQLTTLPESLGQLSNLTVLYLRSNQLTTLPESLGQLSKLTGLDLRSNQLTTLPESLGQLSKLTVLYLSSNQLTTLPESLGQLSKLTGLDLSSNQLTTLPESLGQLSKLTALNLGSNQLTTLPEWLGQLSNLTWLDLSSNQLTTLPEWLGQLTQLRRLDLRKNNLPIPPEILKDVENPKKIINYYQQISIQKRPLNEAKMLVVGQGSVGKTSLVKRLIDGKYNPDENKTDGINIRRWPIQVWDREISLNIWDFGGQEIMHATHQFFLTKRSLYLLVLDCRIGEEENRLEYWLKIIQSFGGESPILIVGNKKDQHPLDIDRAGLQEKYPQIKGFLETSCAQGEGIAELKHRIAVEVDQLPHVNDQLPLPWFELKKYLEVLDLDYLPYYQYQDLCKQRNIDTISQRTLIGFLHDLGVMLNFHDDPRLQDTNILNPEWVTNGVYKILNDNHLMTDCRGKLKLNQLTSILDPDKYPADKHLFLIDMMRKFELCFDLDPDHPNQTFLIPDLLPKEQSYTGEWDETLAFQYHYNVLPPSIISRFIVRMHHRINQNTYWRSGVVLIYEENLALIKSDREDKKMFIWIKGPEATRRNFLNIIRNDFDAIHKSIAKIVAAEKVPLPENPSIILDYEALLGLENMGETHVAIPQLQKRIELKQLLEGIESESTRRQREIGIDEKLNPNLSPTPSSGVTISPPITINNNVNGVNHNHDNKPESWINWQTIWTAGATIVAVITVLLTFWQPILEKFQPKPTPSPNSIQTPH